MPELSLVLQSMVDQPWFVRWSIRGSEFPPHWQEALARREAA